MSRLLLAASIVQFVAANMPDAAIAVGRRFSFYRSSGPDPLLYAMGRNTYGQLGIGSDDDQVNPTPVSLTGTNKEVQSVSAGAFHTLFLTKGGAVFAAGRNNRGQFGEHPDTKVPVQFVESGVQAIAAGYAHSLLLMDNGSVWGVGWNLLGQLGDGTSSSRSSLVKVQIPGNASVTAIAAGHDFSYFLSTDGDVFASGQNVGGQLGDGTQQTQYNPVKVLLQGSAQGIAAGVSHGLFLSNSSVFATGANFLGQLGDNTTTEQGAPKFIEHGFTSVFAGGDSSCASKLAETGKSLYCWGSNIYGQLGYGDVQSMKQPAEVLRQDVARAAVGESHSLFQMVLNEVFASGTNSDGELGDGSTDDKNRAVPIYIPPPTSTRTTTGTATTTDTATATGTRTETTVTASDPRSPQGSGRGSGWLLDPLTLLWLGSAVVAVVTLVLCKSRRPGFGTSQDDEPLGDFAGMELENRT